MKLGSMLSFWALKDMVTSSQVLSSNQLYSMDDEESDWNRHILNRCTISPKEHSLKLADIYYKIIINGKTKKESVSLVHANILFAEKLSTIDSDEIFIPNASLSDLNRHFINND